MKAAESQDGMITRVATIFACFTPDRPTATLSQIARKTGLPISTTSRLLGELVSIGFLFRNEQKHYMIGPSIVELSQSALPYLHLREVASPLLDELTARTGLHVQLAAIDGVNTIILDRRDGKQHLPVFYHIGDRIPLSCTANGHLLLAYASHGIQQSVLHDRRYWWAIFDTNAPEESDLQDLLEHIRASHTMIFNAPGTPIHSVAVPIMDKHNHVIASLAVVFLPDTADIAQVSELLKAYASGISARLRGPLAHRKLQPWGEKAQ